MFLANMLLMKKAWETGRFDFAKGLAELNKALQGSDLLPGAVSLHTMEAIALAMYQRQKPPDDGFQALKICNVQQINPVLLAQEQLAFVAPKNANFMDTSLVFSHLLELKQPHNTSGPAQFAFIETLTASERLRNQLILDQSVQLDGQLFKRTPCCKGRPGDGYVGCVLYQIDALVTGPLGVYLSKAEVELFYQTGAMPSNASSRTCLLCYSQLLTCRAGLFGVRGVGSVDYLDTAMHYQDLVNCNDGFNSKYMILPGNGSTFPLAPFLSFHPRHLRINMRASELYVDESVMWHRAGFRPGAVC